jgi:hypothetical protein
MSRIPPPLARRIDRLARHAHRFHRAAHHPLCAAYAPEVVRLGRRTRLCRGCSALALGGALGLAGGLAMPPLGSAGLASCLLALLLSVALGAAARRGRPRPKWLTRALPGALTTALCLAALRSGTPAGLAVALLGAAAALLGVWRWRARGPDRVPCLSCPQAPAGPRCDGLRPVARRERALSRLAGRWIARATRG